MEQLPITLGIIEDQRSIRRVLVDYLSAQPEFDCVLSADSVEAFLDMLDDAPAPPRLVLSDIGLPGMTGIEGLRPIRQRLPHAEVLMLSVYQDVDRVFQALCAGAVGYLIKNTDLPVLKESLLQVAAGGSPMSPSVARHIVRYFQPSQQPAEPLTAREQQLVQAIADGLSYKLIADRLGITLDTVRGYIRSVYRKLHVNSKSEVVAWALRQPGGGRGA